MNRLEEAATVLQIGVQKGGLVRSGSLDDYSAAPERVALIEAGLMGLAARAGAATTARTPLLPAPAESTRIAHGAPVEEALGDERILFEWAALAAERGMVAPYQGLPGLVAKIPRNPHAILPILGERGRWLAAVMEIPIPVETQDERVGMGDAYESLTINERVAALTKLREGLSSADEPILLYALEDRRKEVRTAAADLIVRFPDSAPAQDLAGRVAIAVSSKRSLLKTTLLVTLPEADDLPKWLPRQGWAGVGPNAAALADLLAHVPPATIEQATGLGRENLIEQIRRSEFSRALMEGLREAALRFDDQNWIDAIFAIEPPVPDELWRRVSDRVFERTVPEWIEGGGKTMDHTLAHLPHRPGSLSRTISLAILKVAKKATAPYFYNDLGRQLDLSLLPLLAEPWEDDGVPEKIRQAWYPALDLRTRLRKSLE